MSYELWGSLGTPFWAPVLNFVQDWYIYTAISGSAVPKNHQYGAKILECCANFSERVNGFFDTILIDWLHQE